jgi:hypothetical protein
MDKKLVILLIISLFLIGCSSQPIEMNGECFSNFDCDDEQLNTLDLCTGNPYRCVYELKTCAEIYGQVCEQGKRCTIEFQTSDEEYCCIGICLDNQTFEERFKNLSICSAMGGRRCETPANCPRETFPTKDTAFCCPVKCVEGDVFLFINKYITGFVPTSVSSSSPSIAFTNEFSEGAMMEYKNDNKNVFVNIWIFEDKRYLNQDVNNHLIGFVSLDPDFSELIYETYKVVGIREQGSDDRSYMWNSLNRVIEISETDDVFLKRYLEKYPSDFETDYFD